MFVLIRQQRQLTPGGTLDRIGERRQRQHLRDPSAAGLRRGGRGDLLPAVELLLRPGGVEPHHAARRGERGDLIRAELRRLLDDVFELVGFGVGHVDAALYARLRRGGRSTVYHQADLLRRDVGDGAAVVGAAAVADEHTVALTQAQDPGMRGVFALKRQKAAPHRPGRNKELRQPHRPPSSRTYK